MPENTRHLSLELTYLATEKTTNVHNTVSDNNSLKILFFISFVLSCHFSFAQKGYQAYYAQINLAKMAAFDSQYVEASQIYFETFKSYEFVFARDCYNAIEVSSLTNDTVRTQYFAEQAIKRGIPVSILQKMPNLSNFRNTRSWRHVLNNADSLDAVYNASINWDIRKEILRMFAKDQEIRSQYYKWYNFPIRPFIGNKWEKTNRNQVHRIIEITEKYGFPGEQLIGIDHPSMHEKIDAHQLSCGMPIVLFVHHYSQPNPSFDFVLLNQIELGNLWNEHFAVICDFEAQFGKNKFEALGYHSVRFSQKDYNPEPIDERRVRIGLLSLKEQKQLESCSVITHFQKRLY